MKTKDLVYQGRESGLLQYCIYNSVWIMAFSRPQKIKGGYLCFISGGIPIRKGVVLDSKMSEMVDARFDEEYVDNECNRYVVVEKDGNGDVFLRVPTDTDIKNSKNNQRL